MNQVQAGSSALMSWAQCTDEAKKIKGFLVSLDALRIGTGLVAFDAEAFQVCPRSEWFNSHIYQWIVNIRNKSANFEAVREGFTQLEEKVQTLVKKIAIFSPQSCEDCPHDVQKLLTLLIRIQIIATESLKGLSQLCENYRTASKFPKASALEQIGKEVFNNLALIEQQLAIKLLPYIPGLEADIKLEKYFFDAKNFLLNRDRYCENLRQIRWEETKGVIVPASFIEDCIENGAQKAKTPPNRDALRLAASSIQLPMMASEIPTQEATMWIPLRFVTSQQVIFKERGVTGTCERDGKGVQNLCNIYYRIDPDTRHLLISSGAFNTQVKADHLVQAILEASPLIGSNTNGRWCVQGLYAFFTEEKIIRDVHHLIPYIETKVQKALQREDISFSFVNTCFNAAATLLPSEDFKSVQGINIESLAQFMQYAFEDVMQLLLQVQTKGESALKNWGNIQFSIQQQCEEATCLSNEIKNIKIKIANDSAGAKLEQLYELQEKLSALTDRKGFGSSSSLTQLIQEEDSLRFRQQSIQETLPKEIKALQALLLHKQKELETKIKQFSQQLKGLIEPLYEPKNQPIDPYLKKTMLIFQVLDRLLSLQFKLNPSSLSRCTEVELFLLLYRLLNIKPIVICWSGLDRSGSVRGLADTQSHTERGFYSKNLRELKQKTPENEYKAQIKAYEQMFQLIMNLDVYRSEIFKLTHLIIGEMAPALNLIKDLASWEQAQKKPATVNIREELCKRIDVKYGENLDKAKNLKGALYYMEYYSKQLLGTEAEKTLYSTGVLGFKYYHDGSWLKKYLAANPHPLQRMSPFIFVEQGEQRHAIQILEYSEGILYNSIPMTPAGLSIFLRLGLLRGK